MELGRRCIDSLHAQVVGHGLDVRFRVDAEAKVVQSILGIKTWQQLTGILREIVITRGRKGGQYIDLANDTSGAYRAIPPAAILCSVGAGDTFAGAFLKARFIDGLNLAESCRYSATIASQKLATEASSLMDLR